MKKKYAISVTLIAILILCGGTGILLTKFSNPWNARSLGDIPAPFGYQRVDAENGTYAAFLRDLPLKKRGSKVMLYSGKEANYQFLSAAVIDMPVISNDEQCADMTMRLRAEYLWMKGRYKELCFTGVDGKKYQYSGGETRNSFESWLKRVYGICNTSSVYRETKERALQDIEPGDVLVYPSRKKGRYGHAILVADVARNRKGKIAVLCVEGNTPARDAHVVRNPNPLMSSWHILGEKDSYQVSAFRFHHNELRHY